MKVTFKGNQIQLAGHFLEKGEKAPLFCLIKSDLSEFSLKDKNGHYLILNVFPSLDTNPCATSIRKFNKIAADFPDTLVVCISKDLPFAHKRFCVTEGIENIITLSDFRYDSDFGKQYGILIENGPLKGLLSRAVFVINPTDRIEYAELIPEITQEPDYEKLLATVKHFTYEKGNS